MMFHFLKSTKFLGVSIDFKMSWLDHIDLVCDKISKAIGVLYRIKDYISRDALIKTYNTIILPYISYGAMVWAATFPSYVNKINLLQKRALRIICNSHYIAPSRPLFIRCKVLNIFDISVYQSAIFMFQYSKGLLPKHFNSYFNNTNHTYPTRGNRINAHFCKLTSTQRFVKFSGPKVWNSLPIHIQSCNTLFSFKRTLKKYLLSKYIE